MKTQHSFLSRSKRASATFGAAAFGLATILVPTTLCQAQTLTGAGATFPYPIYSKWFSVYAQNTGVQINYQPVGSGAGISQLKAGTVDFGASDAPLTDKDEQAMPSPVVHIPTVAGSVVLAYNLPGLNKELKLTPDTIAGIFLGEITKWNDPKLMAINPGVNLPDMAISTAHRSDGSGTTYIFTHYLKAVSPTWDTKVGAGKTVDWPVGLGGAHNDGVAAIVSGSPGGIGYIELAYAVTNHLAFAAVRNHDGHFVVPSVATTAIAAAHGAAIMKQDVRVSIVDSPGAQTYPIVGFTYILVYKHQQDAAKGAILLKFLHWALKDGQKYAAGLYYAPLPKSIVALDEEKLASVK